jgi:hypothetical protein
LFQLCPLMRIDRAFRYFRPTMGFWHCPSRRPFWLSAACPRRSPSVALLAVGRQDAMIEEEFEHLDVGILMLDRAGRVVPASGNEFPDRQDRSGLSRADAKRNSRQGAPEPGTLRVDKSLAPVWDGGSRSTFAYRASSKRKPKGTVGQTTSCCTWLICAHYR